ncbi:MAG: hypothetical protein QXH10_09235 [Ignisphaera sp.]|uniref:Uncharacterized protein n=1 Tax=Ligamenvirales sp. TaxID=2832923 RepID=A0AAU6PX85_9VIRU
MSILTSLAHILYGFISALSITVHPVMPVLCLVLFIVYELDQEWHISDKAYDELAEYCIGFCIALTLLIAYRCFLSLW